MFYTFFVNILSDLVRKMMKSSSFVLKFKNKDFRSVKNWRNTLDYTYYTFTCVQALRQKIGARTNNHDSTFQLLF